MTQRTVPLKRTNSSPCLEDIAIPRIMPSEISVLFPNAYSSSVAVNLHLQRGHQTDRKTDNSSLPKCCWCFLSTTGAKSICRPPKALCRNSFTYNATSLHTPLLPHSHIITTSRSPSSRRIHTRARLTISIRSTAAIVIAFVGLLSP